MSESTRQDVQAQLQRSALWAIARNVKTGFVNKGLVLGLALLVVDVLIVAHFRPATAAALIRHTPPITLIAGVMLNLTPLAAKTIVVFCLFKAALDYVNDKVGRAVAYFFVGVVAWGASLVLLDENQSFSSWVMCFLVAGSWAAGAAGHWLHERFFTDDGPSLGQFATASVVLLATLGSFASGPAARAALTQPFIPLERVEMKDASSVVGYVLDVDQSGQWTTILVEADRSVLIVNSDDVTSRQLCNTNDTLDQFTPRQDVFHFEGAEPYPECEAG